jgi:PmbA protein
VNGVPFDHEDARRAFQSVAAFEGADDVELVITASTTGLTRFALSEIIQNTVRREVNAYVRIAVGLRSATAATTQLDDEHLLAAARSALVAARASPEDAEFPGLPSPDEVGRAEALFRWDDATAETTPAGRAKVVREIVQASGPHRVAGAYETSSHAYAVLSSKGMDCYDAHTRCVVSGLVDTTAATGWGEDSSYAAHEVDAGSAVARARKKAESGAGAVSMEPGHYEVVLEPAAVATMIDYLSYSGMGAKQVLDGDSWLAERAGKPVAAPEITVADDVFHPTSVGIGFDFEGVPKRRVPVIDHGVATGPVTDYRTAKRLGVSPTGHFSGSVEFGPYASHVVVGGGEKSLEDLIGEVEDGVLVTRFHYVNVLDRPSTLLTGMTRDGTFRISRGEIKEPLRNFRFAQSVLESLDAAADIGRDLVAFAPNYGSFGCTVAPALRVSDFHFASTTSH